MGLYFKKLIYCALAAAACLLVYYVCGTVVLAFLNTFTHIYNETLKSIIVLSVPFLAVAVTAYKSRIKSKALRREYLAGLEIRKFDFLRESKSVIKSPDYFAELLAFATVLVPCVIIITLNGAAPSVLDKILNSLEAFLQIMGFLLVSNLAIWLLVHAKWFSARAK